MAAVAPLPRRLKNVAMRTPHISVEVYLALGHGCFLSLSALHFNLARRRVIGNSWTGVVRGDFGDATPPLFGSGLVLVFRNACPGHRPGSGGIAGVCRPLQLSGISGLAIMLAWSLADIAAVWPQARTSLWPVCGTRACRLGGRDLCASQLLADTADPVWTCRNGHNRQLYVPTITWEPC